MSIKILSIILCSFYLNTLFCAKNENILTLNIHIGSFSNSLSYKNTKDKLRFLEGRNSTHYDSTVIYGNSSVMNYYYVDIYIGTPLKKQTLIIDTGSGYTGVPCKSLCEKCGKHLNSYYDPIGKILEI